MGKYGEWNMPNQIRVTILDDHQGIIDGYLYRLNSEPKIEVVATLAFGEELEPALKKNPSDVLILDVNVPTSADNPASYPILQQVPKLLQTYPNLYILIITMVVERGLIQAVMEAGASGYILKDDQHRIRDLANILVSVASGGVHFSPIAYDLLLKHQSTGDENPLTPRQLEVLSLCASYPNSSTSQLAVKMNVSHSTVRNLLSGTYIRLGVHTRSAAIEKARQLGILTSFSGTLSFT